MPSLSTKRASLASQTQPEQEYVNNFLFLFNIFFYPETDTCPQRPLPPLPGGSARLPG